VCKLSALDIPEKRVPYYLLRLVLFPLSIMFYNSSFVSLLLVGHNVLEIVWCTLFQCCRCTTALLSVRLLPIQISKFILCFVRFFISIKKLKKSREYPCLPTFLLFRTFFGSARGFATIKLNLEVPPRNKPNQ